MGFGVNDLYFSSSIVDHHHKDHEENVTATVSSIIYYMYVDLLSRSLGTRLVARSVDTADIRVCII